MSAGVRYFSGPAIAEETEKPEPVRRLALADILTPPAESDDVDDTFEID